MKKSEFERKIKKLNLEKVHRQGKIQTYSRDEKEYYKDNERENLYGCYYNAGQYTIFFTDAERGILEELGYYQTEDEAYDNLFRIIQSWEDDYQKMKNNK